jgi:integrase
LREHAHLFRHGIAQRAGHQGAAVGEIQTLLGHATPAMARCDASQALNRQGAQLMVQYSPLN